MADEAYTPEKINLSTLASADVEFTELATDAPTAECRSAFGLAARITNSAFHVRAGVLATLQQMEANTVTIAQAARMLRYIIEEV